MGLFDELKSDQGHNRNRGCMACDWLETRDPKERVEWDDALADKSFSYASLFRAMKKRGATFTIATLSRHRRGHA